MHRRLFNLIVAVLTTLTVACQPDDTGETDTAITISKTEFTFPAVGGRQELYVRATADVKVISPEAWCVVNQEAYASDRSSKFSLNVSENPDVSKRTVSLTVYADSEEVGKVSVIQNGHALIVDASQVPELPYEGGTFTIKVRSSEDYDVSLGGASWLELREKNINESFALFECKANTGIYGREANITFSSKGESHKVHVSQEAGEYDAPEPDMSGMESDARTLMRKMALGINLGNTLEAIGGETAWGAPKTTEAMIKYFKELGFNAVRIPCSWDQNLEKGGGYIVKESWMKRVKEVVDYVVDNDMYAILNIHWDGGWMENDIPNGYDKDVNEKLQAIWMQIAMTFRDYDEHLVFAGANEPNVETAAHMSTLLKYEQTFINTVRVTGGRNAYRVLVFQGPSTDVDKTEKLMNTIPSDQVEGRLAAEVHYYTPWTFCGLNEDADWGKMMFFWGDDQEGYATGSYAGRWDRNYNEAYVAKQMAKMKAKFWDKGIPVIIGEYSVCTQKTCNLGDYQENQKAYEGYMKSRAAFNACVVRESKANGCVPFYWHCEGDLVSRKDLKVTEQATYEAIIEAGKTQYPEF